MVNSEREKSECGAAVISGLGADVVDTSLALALLARFASCVDLPGVELRDEVETAE